MKCKKCGHTSKTIGAMAAHYRKAHPGSMKARKHRVSTKRGGLRTIMQGLRDKGYTEREIMNAYYDE